MGTTLNPDTLLWPDVQPFYAELTEAPLDAASMPAFLKRWSDLEKQVNEAQYRSYRARTENTADANASARYEQLVSEVQPRAKAAAQVLRDRVLSVPGYRPGPEEEVLFRRFQAQRDLFREANLPIETELALLGAKYDEIVGSMSVTLDGEALTMAEADSRLEDPDRARREAAWRAMMACFQAARPALNDLFLKMRPLRRQLAANAGLPDYREYVWREYARFDYRPEDCTAFHAAIEAEIVPLAARLLERRRAWMGLDSLRPWDTEVDPLGRAALKPFDTAEQLEAGVSRMLHRLDPALGADFDLLRQGFLDLGSRPNKAPGGYCEFFPVSGRPYIFMNAVGTHDDVNTLLHEGGHSLHALASSRAHDLVWNHWSPMEFAEVGSMAMELLAAPYLEQGRGGFYGHEDAGRARAQHLERAVLFLPYMAVVDAFQHWLYTTPDEVTPASLDAAWANLWERFMPVTDWSGLEAERESGWQRKLHIFQMPFYYIEYGLSQVGAFQVWRNSLSDAPAALAAYRDALALGYTRPLPELYATAGARLAFDRETLAGLRPLLAEHLGLNG
ncbi:MAG TPA: M3 family oligoendopeptidase [Deinococcales bacterium]|nr:M3 family oligoendopeptidase [Deinococcales bacterium]